MTDAASPAMPPPTTVTSKLLKVPRSSIERARRQLLGSLLGALVGVVACKEPTASAPAGTWALPPPASSLALVQVGATDLVAVRLPEGEPLWRHRHTRAQPLRSVRLAEPRLLCAPQVTPDRGVLLRYDDAVHLLEAASGRLLWERACTLEECTSHCPVVTSDSGVVLPVERGRAVTKLGRVGLPSWSFSVPRGTLASSLQASPEGGVVLRTATELFVVGPEGTLVSARTLASVGAASAAPGLPATPVPRVR